MSDLLTGRIVWDIDGTHYLETFEGVYLIPESTFEAAWSAIVRENDSGYKPAFDNIRGVLARGRVESDEIVDLSYYLDGCEWPDRSAYRQAKRDESTESAESTSRWYVNRGMTE